MGWVARGTIVTRLVEVDSMTQALTSAVAEATKLPPAEQDALAAFLLEEIASEHRWSQSFAKSQGVLESLASEALAEFKAGKAKPLDDL